MDHFVYVVRCADGTFYTGYTVDVTRRVQRHNEGKGAKYTRQRRPVNLVYVQQYGTKSEAMSMEHSLKRLPRAVKSKLVGAAHSCLQRKA